MKRVVATLGAIVGSGLMLVTHAGGTELIVNGDFETGTLAGWSQSRMHGGNVGGFYAAADGMTPVSGHATVGPASGSGYAVADQSGPGATVMLQTFSIDPGSTAVLSFALFVNNYGGNVSVNPAGLVWNAVPNQHARVDILTAGSDPFSTAAGDVLGNFYLGADAGGNPHGYTGYSFDITSMVGTGGTFQLRFAEVSNQGYFNVGVDNVSINATIPEPEPIALLHWGLLLAGFGWLAQRHRGR